MIVGTFSPAWVFGRMMSTQIWSMPLRLGTCTDSRTASS
jgi:hypothetical protein